MPVIRVVRVRIIRDGEEKLALRRIVDLPVEIAPDVVAAPYVELPNKASIPVGAIHPYFGERRQAKVREIMKACWFKNPIQPEMLLQSVSEMFDEHFTAPYVPDPRARRYIHLDLAFSVCAVGIAMGHLSLMMPDPNQIATAAPTFVKRPKPKVVIDFAASIPVTEQGEIELPLMAEMIRELDRRGFIIELVTCDQAQSRHTIQDLRREGYIVAVLSIDRTSSAIVVDPVDPELGYRKESTDGQYCAAMAALRDLIDADDALLMPNVPVLLSEIGGADFDVQRQKVDHTGGGTIDVLQSVAGVCFNIVNNENMGSVLGGPAAAWPRPPEDTEEERSRIDDDFYKSLRADGERVKIPGPEALDTDGIYDAEGGLYDDDGFW